MKKEKKKNLSYDVFSQHCREAKNGSTEPIFSTTDNTHARALPHVSGLKIAHSLPTMALRFTVYKPYSKLIVSFYFPYSPSG